MMLRLSFKEALCVYVCASLDARVWMCDKRQGSERQSMNYLRNVNVVGGLCAFNHIVKIQVIAKTYKITLKEENKLSRK